MTAPEPPALTGIDLLRQRRDALVAASTAATAHAHVDSPATMRAEPGPDPATVLVEPIDYPSGPLAWSEAADTAMAPVGSPGEFRIDDPAEDDGRRPLSTALLVFLVSVLAAGVTLAVLLIGYHEARTAPRPELDAPSIVAPPPAQATMIPESPPAPVAQQPAVPPVSHDPADKYTAPAVKTTPDQDFDWLVRNGSVDVPISDDLGHNAGRALCRWISQAPRTDSDVYYHLQGVFPGLTAAQLGTFGGAAEEAYCPQYRNLPD